MTKYLEEPKKKHIFAPETLGKLCSKENFYGLEQN